MSSPGRFVAFLLTVFLGSMFGTFLKVSQQATKDYRMNLREVEANQEKKTLCVTTIQEEYEISTTNNKDANADYKPSLSEAYVLSHLNELNMTAKSPDLVRTCHIWNNPKATPYHEQLQQYKQELQKYYSLLKAFQTPHGIEDVRLYMTSSESHREVCNKFNLAAGSGSANNNMSSLFPNSHEQLLSYTATNGYLEPLLAPFRHPLYCSDVYNEQYLMRIDYLLHDWHHMCMNQLTRTSRTIFVDMGASLQFHGTGGPAPALELMDLYRKFGIKFDHIYAYEMTQQSPQSVVDAVPKHYQAAYHWINVGVSADPKPDNNNNPFNMLKQNYNPNDLIIVKLDIDTPYVEQPLVEQLLSDPDLASIIDHFYFEHHINQQELHKNWKGGEIIGDDGVRRAPYLSTVAESLQLFTQLRQMGIAAHYWV